MQPFEGEYIPNIMNGRAEFILGDLADYSSGKLLFTEDEVIQRVNDLCSLYDTTAAVAPDGKEMYPYSVTNFGMQLAENMSLLPKEPVPEDGRAECFYGTEPLTLVPLYSDDGGVTASIMSFAAINRNSQRPEEAFTVKLFLPVREGDRGGVMNALKHSQDLVRPSLQSIYHIDALTADRYFRDMWLVVHSLATLIVTGECLYSEEEIGEILTGFSVSVYKAMKEIPGFVDNNYDKDAVFKALLEE